MRFPPSILDEIRARLPVSAVVGRRVRLMKAGREWKGLSPFNAEKTASFFVNDDKQRYFDFSSGRNGDIFNFVMETEGLSFGEAVERLAAEAGVSLPRETPEDARREEKRQGLHEIVELAARWFEYELTTERGARARDYLDRRGLGPDVRRRFRLGYAPAGRHELQNALAAKGVSVEAMIDAGLLIAGQDIPTPYDRFRDRVIFPICDARGRPVAFGGRAMAADVQPKYLNSPETPLFHKGALLYNFHNARKAVHGGGDARAPFPIIVAEGYVDVIALDMAGAPQAVATLGTAMTPDHLALLWRSVDAPVLCFDGDRAGRRAAFRALDVALPLLAPGKSVNFVLLPEGQDPDDLLRAGGPEAVLAALGVQVPLIDMLWTRETEAGALDTPDQRAALEHRLRDVVFRIQDETVRRHYRAEIDMRVAALMPGAQGRDERAFSGRRGNWQGNPQGGWRQGSGGGRFQSGGRGGRGAAGQISPGASLAAHPGFAASAEFPREMLIVALLIAHPDLLADHGEELAALEFRGPEARRAAAGLLDCIAAHGADQDYSVALRRAVQDAGLLARLDGLRKRMAAGAAWALAPEADRIDVEGMLRQAMTLQSRSGALHSELAAAERAFAEEESEANFSWLCDVKARLTTLEGAEAQADEGRW
ncbi:DNA primase [Camelimonas fluminis]|uniref:DNA primase n=1 Tax=Camelimonas fluminis TaxID=1576911 RepID=A0ABV7UGX9_9HYPH|nr:DNA primase [Camelimonas fluminis]GHE71067.1 DNA primase [Camelimonas fluminis]